MTGTSILNPNGVFTDPMGYGAGYGFGYGYGGSGTFTAGNYNPTVHWDLIGEADAIQSTDPVDDLVDLYWIEQGDLASIFDSVLSDEQSSNSGGGSGSGEGPNTSRSPSQQASQKRQFDFEIFKVFLQRIDPIALQTFESGNGKLEFGSAMLWGEISVSHRGQPIHGDLTFWVDEKWSELDAAARVAQYIAEERTEVRSRYQYIAIEELGKGNWMATIGLLPFVPATGFVRIVDKAGNSKLIDNVMMHKLRELGTNSAPTAKRYLDNIPTAPKGDGRVLIGIVKPGGQVDEALKAHYMNIAKSPQMLGAIDRYNAIAKILGQKKSASIDEIIVALGSDVTFSRIGHFRSGVFVPGEHIGKTKYWLQGKPSTMYGRRVGKHELVHLGAAINGQSNRVWHEVAVQLATTPENLVAVTTGVVVAIGAEIYWLNAK